ncbi:tRNA (adenosine(37)-N6)-threonylcarbamoyltransferase complex dimerization subunit type 1 TsaB [Terrarubrum flagellatum]|uniref:tRNA (adenosine(37)-N6)-threonylcarbamoyltransferase complex dimerization subunit type 1 TsaB n=1 Tax=Terrirubrum flagellatum TaxID=2895980 RepID=UPI0031450842
MRILAIDTALGACSVCIWEAGRNDPLGLESTLMERGHAEALVPMIGRVAEAAGGFSGIDRISVTVGPGSYTGLRVGVSAARALALATDKPAIGVTTLSALAAPLVAAGESTLIAAVIDARHSDVHLQLVAPNGRTILTPRQLPAREAARAIGAGPVRLVGSGAPKLGVEAWQIGLDATIVDPAAAPDILWVARLGALADPDEAPPKPLYLKPPDAKPQAAARLAVE